LLHIPARVRIKIKECPSIQKRDNKKCNPTKKTRQSTAPQQIACPVIGGSERDELRRLVPTGQ